MGIYLGYKRTKIDLFNYSTKESSKDLELKYLHILKKLYIYGLEKSLGLL